MAQRIFPSVDRREVIAGAGSAALACACGVSPAEAAPSSGGPFENLKLRVNDGSYSLSVDPRTSLLDLLREVIGLTGTKKGCDHGQCGACTVLLNGRRINACLTLAIMHEGDAVTTIEGLGSAGKVHPMQAAFVKHDAFQCGYCTSGQICSSVAMLEEIRAGSPSHVTEDLEADARFSGPEMRERMSGNICRCGAYSNIFDAVVEVSGAV